MGLQDIGNRRVANLVADLGELALNPVATPGGILLGKLQSQIDNHLADSWPSLFFLSIRIVPFGGEQLSMPTEDGVRREQSANLIQKLSTEGLSLDCQSSALIIIKQDSFRAKLCFQNSILGTQVFDHFLLLAIEQFARNMTIKCHGCIVGFIGTRRQGKNLTIIEIRDE